MASAVLNQSASASAPDSASKLFESSGSNYKYKDTDEHNLTTVLTPDSPRVSQPDEINIDLKQHQLALIYKCDQIEHTSHIPFKVSDDTDPRFKYEVKSKVGVIADVVGSGKTLSILGLIAKFKSYMPKYNFLDINFHQTYNSSGYIGVKTVGCPSIDVINTTFVVVPHTIFTQWKDVVSKTVTDMVCYLINNKKSLELFNSYIEQCPDGMNEPTQQTRLANLNKTDFIVVSSTFVQRLAPQLFNQYNYRIFIRRLVIDEGDSIKMTRDFLNLTPMFTWIVTSTYQSVINPSGKVQYQNSLTGEVSDYYNWQAGFTTRKKVSGFQHRGFVYNMALSFSQQIKPLNVRKLFIVKNDNEFVNMAFKLEPAVERIIKCAMPLSLHVISHAVSNSILNKINAGDLEGALDELECDRVSEKDLIDAVTKDLNHKLENKKIEFEMKSKMNWPSEQIKKETLDKIVTKIKELEIKIQNITDKLNDNKVCNICFDDIETTTIAPCCNTKFCFECITKWLALQTVNKTCPFCRHPLGINSLILVDEQGSKKKVEKAANKLLSKIDTFRVIVKERKELEANLKLLVFTDYSSSLNKYIPVLEELGLTYSKISGTTATIAKRIREFKSTDNGIDCLLLNAEFCASGLNLENTTDIFITHKMTGSKMHQIIGRGQRPGRQGQLNVWKLFYENEMNNN